MSNTKIAKITKSEISANVAAADVTPKSYVIGPNSVTGETKLKYVPNPKRKNSKAWARYEQYQTATTFAEYQELNQDKQSIPDIKHDLNKGFVEIS